MICIVMLITVRTVVSRDASVLVALYKSLLTPRVQYCCSALVTRLQKGWSFDWTNTTQFYSAFYQLT